MFAFDLIRPARDSLMRQDHRFGNTVVAGMVLWMSFMLGAAAHAEDYGPANAAAALQQLSGWRCSLNLGCPISSDAYAALTGALAGDRELQYKLAQLLQRGDGIPRDVRASTGWYGKAAEQGHVAAALELNRLRHEGAAIPADETKIAAALHLEVDKGDRDAMRALADMQVYGRGLPRDAEQGLALLQRAAAAGSAAAAEDLSKLFLRDAPGVPRNPAEGFRWMEESARLGNSRAMLDLGSMYFNFPDAAMRDPAEGYRWLMRAALVDNPTAQEMLSVMLAKGAMVGARTVIPPDLIAADMWLRLAARSPFHDNASQRLQIESNMTAAKLAEAEHRAAAWRPNSLEEVLAMTIPLPAVLGAKPPWPPELHGRALDRFNEAGENPPLWLRMPDFARNEEIMSAITAIAAQCESSGNKHCAETCRQQLDYVAPPIKPGGLSAAELARYLQDHPKVSPVRAMRREAATPEQSMHFGALCANGIDDRL
jgi:TPR repeat protein